MADVKQLYHMKSNCINYDVTSNLKQNKHGEVLKMQSRGLMSTRPPDSSNFSAWIERFKSFDFVKDTLDEEPGEAQVAAMEMQAKLTQIEKDRNEKLEKFQQDVRERVKRMRRQKLNEQITKSIQRVEKENNVMCQSAFPKKVPSPKSDVCSFRSSISVDKIKSIMTGEANFDPSHNIESILKSVDGIDKNAEKIKHQSNRARARLVSRIVGTHAAELPGGVWGELRPSLNVDEFGQTDADQHKPDDHERNDIHDELSERLHENTEVQRGILLNNMWKNFNADERKEASVKDEAPYRKLASGEKETQMNEKRKKERKKIRFHLPEGDVNDPCKGNQIKDDMAKSRFGIDMTHDHSGKRDDNNEMEKKAQYWTYRKLFMDIEREKVRERQRRKKHEQVISRLKRDKEIERSLIEREVEVVIPKQTCEQQEDRTIQLQQDCRSGTKTESKVVTRRKEILRYIEALKKLIHQKTLENETVLPSICSCGGSLLDTNPETCANNCIFYNNPQGLARVLSSVLSGVNK